MTKNNSHINVENSTREEQLLVMKQIQKDGVCPFCREHFETYHTKPILFETNHWVVTENAWPYPDTKHHFLAAALFPIIALVTVFSFVLVANNFAEFLGVANQHNAILITIIYVVMFSIPHTVAKVHELRRIKKHNAQAL